MKRMKKIFAVILSLAMVLGMSLTALAAGSAGNDGKIGTSDDTGTITVSGIEGSSVTVNAYKIVEAVYGNNGQSFEGYKLVKDWEGVSLTRKEGTGGGKPSLEIDKDDIFKIYNSNNLGTPITMSPSSSESTTYTATGLGVGSYLVVVSDSDAAVYAPVVVSIEYALNDNGNAVEIKDGTGSAKKTDSPSVEKEAKTADTTGQSAKIGEDVEYEVVLKPIPYYVGTHPVFNVEDTLSSGLKYKEGSFTIQVADIDSEGEYTNKINLAESKYSATLPTASDSNNNKIQVDFVNHSNNKDTYLLNDYAEKAIIITYKATVTNDAAMNQAGNANDVVLKYTKDSTTNAGENPPSTGDKTYTYTFDLNGAVSGDKNTSVLNKVGVPGMNSSSTTPLAGAEFTLYTNQDCADANKYTNSAIVKGQIEENGATDAIIFDGANGKVTSDINGNLFIKGLAAGTYYLKETAAPEGYTLNEHVYVIVINAMYRDVTEDGMSVKKLDSYTITVDGNEVIKLTAGTTNVTYPSNKVDIKNTELSSLPSTGGIGTTIFTIGGCAIMIIAAALFFASRRREAK